MRENYAAWLESTDKLRIARVHFWVGFYMGILGVGVAYSITKALGHFLA